MVIYPMFLGLLLMLSGCSTKEFHLGWYDKCLPKTVVKIKKVHPQIAEEALSCTTLPKPDLNITKQSEVSKYLIDLTVAGKTCENKLNYVRMVLLNFKGNSDD